MYIDINNIYIYSICDMHYNDNMEAIKTINYLNIKIVVY